MSSGLTHSGAIARGLAYVPAKDLRAWGRDADERTNVTAAKPAQPSENAAEARERIREQVMAERGIDLFDLYLMGSQQRIVTEAAIMSETALRAREAQSRMAQAGQPQPRQTPARATANFVDLRV